jgi:hypothetical protein
MSCKNILPGLSTSSHLNIDLSNNEIEITPIPLNHQHFPNQTKLGAHPNLGQTRMFVIIIESGLKTASRSCMQLRVGKKALKALDKVMAVVKLWCLWRINEIEINRP